MFRLAVPEGVHDNRVLDYLKNQKELQEGEHFKREPDGGGLVDYIFPNMGEDMFRYITIKLKNQGVTMIGVDTQLTESKIMKLADLITEAPTLEEMKRPKWLEALKSTLREWEQKTYNDDKHKWESYYIDIEEMIKAWEESIENDDSLSEPIAEQKLRKLIRKTIRE